MQKLSALFLVIFLLGGCSYLGSKSSANPPSPNESLCQELKRNIIFDVATGPSFGAAPATQKAEMYRLYNKYNCTQFEKK